MHSWTFEKSHKTQQKFMQINPFQSFDEIFPNVKRICQIRGQIGKVSHNNGIFKVQYSALYKEYPSGYKGPIRSKLSWIDGSRLDFFHKFTNPRVCVKKDDQDIEFLLHPRQLYVILLAKVDASAKCSEINRVRAHFRSISSTPLDFLCSPPFMMNAIF